MFGEDYLGRLDALDAEEDLLRAVRRCRDAMDRDRLTRVLEWHARLSSKGRHTGDSDHLGAACPPDQSRE